jgi:hypothetical protein
MNDSDAERFDRIRRKIQYGATIKDLFWLVRLVEKLEKQVASKNSPQRHRDTEKNAGHR